MSGHHQTNSASTAVRRSQTNARACAMPAEEDLTAPMRLNTTPVEPRYLASTRHSMRQMERKGVPWAAGAMTGMSPRYNATLTSLRLTATVTTMCSIRTCRSMCARMTSSSLRRRLPKKRFKCNWTLKTWAYTLACVSLAKKRIASICMKSRSSRGDSG